MRGRMLGFIKKMAGKARTVPAPDAKPDSWPADLPDDFRQIYERCREFTMTSRERMYALYQAVNYAVEAGIPGDMVECGVWKGGSAMVMAMALARRGSLDRKIYLYDTFAGMVKPTEKDRKLGSGASALDGWEGRVKAGYVDWCYASREEVSMNMASTGYPPENIVFVQGKVEETIPASVPAAISVLRLDTDWYESTLHELKWLYPLLSLHGVLVLDDYGHWAGMKEAFDTYYAQNRAALLLTRVDGSARIGVKII